jgi:hypothetical protein
MDQTISIYNPILFPQSKQAGWIQPDLVHPSQWTPSQQLAVANSILWWKCGWNFECSDEEDYFGDVTCLRLRLEVGYSLKGSAIRFSWENCKHCYKGIVFEYSFLDSLRLFPEHIIHHHMEHYPAYQGMCYLHACNVKAMWHAFEVQFPEVPLDEFDYFSDDDT